MSTSQLLQDALELKYRAQIAEAKAIAMQLKRDLVNGSPCTKLNARKIAGEKVFTCKKINKKLIWKM